MNFLVGDLVLSGGEKVTVIWSDGRRTDEIRLQNRFMRQKGIKIIRYQSPGDGDAEKST